MPGNAAENVIEERKYNQGYLATIKCEKQVISLK